MNVKKVSHLTLLVTKRKFSPFFLREKRFSLELTKKIEQPFTFEIFL